jgi:hypothetical protein
MSFVAEVGWANSICDRNHLTQLYVVLFLTFATKPVGQPCLLFKKCE